jgi:hypothetical protein
MSGRHALKPSPLAGEGAERRRREAGEGTFVAGIALKECSFSHPLTPPALRAGTPLPQGERGGARRLTGAQR